MPKFIAIPMEDARVQYLNLELIRAVHDHPDEDGVIVDYDGEHRVYLDRQKAKKLLELVASSS